MLDMRLFVQSYLGEPVKQGSKWWVWHCRVNKPDRNPSLKIEANGFKCFSCGAAGGPFQFLVKELGYSEAAARLEVGHKPKARHKRDVSFEVGVSPPLPEWQRVFIQLWQYSCATLFAPEAVGQFGRDYLKGRGLEWATCQHFQLGYCPRWFSVPEFDTWLAPGIVIPAFGGSVAKLLWSLEVRVLDGGPLKYHRPRGVSEPVPFGLAHLQDKDTLVITEGSFDALSVWQVAGDEVDVLALRGSHNSLRFWMGYLAGYKRVIVATDADQAGDRIAQDLRAQHLTWERRRPERGDLNDMLRAGLLSKDWILRR